MRKPNPDEKVVCPKSRNDTAKPPKSCWESNHHDGTRIIYGVLGSHSHGFYSSECEYTGHVVRVITPGQPR